VNLIPALRKRADRLISQMSWNVESA
jgi:hypothetical protein